jgi:hypothetical protein
MDPCNDDADYKIDCGVYGVCEDEAAPSEHAHCNCNKCYESEVSGVQNGGPPKCVNHNYCESSEGAQRHHCDIAGDTKATCVDKECKYECNCSTGYEEVNGVCEDINACEDNVCNKLFANSGTCVDDAAPSLGYECYCHCGYQDRDGVCHKCNEFKPIMNAEGAKAGTVTLSNDDVFLTVEIEILGKYSLVQSHVNVNHGARRSDIRTQRDGATYQVDGTSAECVGDPAAFGVMNGETLGSPHKKNEHDFKYSIPLADIEMSSDSEGNMPGCGLSLLVYLELMHDSTGEQSVFFAADTGVVSCANGNFFAISTFTLCGVPMCSNDATSVVGGF